MTRYLIPCIYLSDEKAVTGLYERKLLGDGDPVALAERYARGGADRILVFDFSDVDREHDEAIGVLRKICRASSVPVFCGGNIRREEDVKKILYAGCAAAVLNGSKASNLELLPDVSKRFGREKIIVSAADVENLRSAAPQAEDFASAFLLLGGDIEEAGAATSLPVIRHSAGGEEEAVSVLRSDACGGLAGAFVSAPGTDLFALKDRMAGEGVPMNIVVPAVPWAELKANDRGLVPCIVQDDRTGEVLMMAWMNEESFRLTLRTGRMTYFSRSRQSLWLKGETSGHFQYLRSLNADCDRDVLLARVDQVGAACHTGSRSCFFSEIVPPAGERRNPYQVFEQVMAVIEDRRLHPKEGSYTNYLFDKGIDKILKKVGEENTELIIAAKNPNPDEIRYEIADYLYHLMVLMAEKGVSWEDITDELARR